MKMSTRKVCSIVISVLALYLFINMFFPYIGQFSYTANLWDISTAISVFLILNLVGIAAVYMLHLFGILKEKWVSFANYAVGYVALYHVGFLFDYMEYTKVGLWLGTIAAIAMITLSVLWYFMSDEAFGGSKAPITGYDAKTGKPIYAKQKGFDPHTGKPIYED